MFCRCCGTGINDSVQFCPQCGGAQQGPLPGQPQATQPLASPADDTSKWLGIGSLILGIVSVLALFDDSEWDEETILGLGIFAVGGLVCGILSINKRAAGTPMPAPAIAGTVMCGIAMLGLLGLLAE
jgi:hypothetical protein